MVKIDLYSPRFWMVALLAWALVTCFSRLGQAPVYTVNEAREGVYMRAMFDTGNFILPQVPNHVENGEIVPDKPPLFHWLSAAAVAARGVLATGALPDGPKLSRRYDEWSHRFPSALCGILMVMGVAIMGRRLVGARAAWLAAASLLLSLQFVNQSRCGRVDMPLAASVTFAMLLASHALLDGSKGAFLLAAGASGLGVLAKGPLGIVLPVVACGTWVVCKSAVNRSIRWLAPFPWAWGALICLFVGLPWYFAAYASGGMAVINSQLLHENFEQFAGTNSRMSFFYYVEPWLTGSFPWNLLALAGIGLAWRSRQRGAVFCAIWWISFLAFFQMSAYKRGSYLLPALPAGALLAGAWLDAQLSRSDERRGADIRAALAPWWKPTIILSSLAGGIGAVLVWRRVGPFAVGTDWRPLDGALALAASTVVLSAVFVLLRALWQRNAWGAVVALGAAGTALTMGIQPAWKLKVAEMYSPKPLVQRVMHDLPSGQTVTLYGIEDDPSMLLLLYFHDSERIHVIPAGTPLPINPAAGYYLCAATAWHAVQTRPTFARTTWRMLWQASFPQRGEKPVPVVFVERRD